MDYSDLRWTDFETKADDANDVAAFSGIASTSDLDLHSDIIEPGAFEPIARKDNGSPDVLLLRDHDRTQVIGGWRRFVQEGRRLLVEGELCLAVEKARETYALLKRGYLSGLSVAFIPDKSGVRWDERTGKRTISRATLKECSIVAYPANENARVVNVKSDIVDWFTASGLCEVEIDVMMQEGIDAVIEIRKRKGPNVTPQKPWGDVDYADPGYQEDGVHRYPIHTERNIRAAWSYINMPRNQAPYTREQLERIKRRIIAAWKDKIDPEGPPAAREKDLPFRGIDGHFPLDSGDAAAAVRGLSLAMKERRSHV